MKIGRGFLKRTTVVMLLLVTCFGCDARSAGTPESMAAYAMRTVLDEYVAQHESFPESWAELMAEPEFREKFEPYLQKFNLRLSLWRGELTVMQQEYAFLKAPVPMRGYGSNARVLLIQRTLQKSSELRLRLGYILAFQDRTKPGWFGEEEGRTLLESVELQHRESQGCDSRRVRGEEGVAHWSHQSQDELFGEEGHSVDRERPRPNHDRGTPCHRYFFLGVENNEKGMGKE